MASRRQHCAACGGLQPIEYDYSDNSVLLACQHIVRLPAGHENLYPKVPMAWPRNY
jgi:hypothetical protein